MRISPLNDLASNSLIITPCICFSSSFWNFVNHLTFILYLCLLYKLFAKENTLTHIGQGQHAKMKRKKYRFVAEHFFHPNSWGPKLSKWICDSHLSLPPGIRISQIKNVLSFHRTFLSKTYYLKAQRYLARKFFKNVFIYFHYYKQTKKVRISYPLQT